MRKKNSQQWRRREIESDETFCVCATVERMWDFGMAEIPNDRNRGSSISISSNKKRISFSSLAAISYILTTVCFISYSDQVLFHIFLFHNAIFGCSANSSNRTKAFDSYNVDGDPFVACVCVFFVVDCRQFVLRSNVFFFFLFFFFSFFSVSFRSKNITTKWSTLSSMLLQLENSSISFWFRVLWSLAHRPKIQQRRHNKNETQRANRTESKIVVDGDDDDDVFQ